jgi:hydroxymethylpyrimidine pyrophosphatase-like HAD family hydrolase
LWEREIYVHQDAQFVEWAGWNQACQRDHDELFARVRGDVPRLVEWISKRFSATLYEDDYSPFCLVAETNEHADRIQEYLETYSRGVPSLAVVRNDVYARFSHVAYNKGTALGEIARLLGIGREHVLAAGDHFNDVPMLSQEFAGYLVAPDNSIDPVKDLVRRQGGYVSHQPWGHGVARGLEHYLAAAGFSLFDRG